jgi:diguanylate cyclase (GGDEF)-like protein
MSSKTERAPAPRRLPSLQSRLLVFAAAVLAPVLMGALACGLLLLFSASRSQALAEEMISESAVSVSLFQNLETARIAGSSYMEEGEHEDLAEFRSAAVQVDRALGGSAFDERAERGNLLKVEREWRAAARQLRDSRTGVGTSRDDAADPEDVFETHVNAAISGVGGLVTVSQREIRSDLAATRRINRAQSLVALVALLSSLAVAALLTRRLAAAALRPIHRLTQAARAFGSGHLAHRVAVTSSRELHEMADTFNRMAVALQEQHDQLEQQAFTDSLTGIPNRALFEDRARHALDRTLRTSERVAVLMIDLDDFKLVNDGLGHASGDELIAAAAQRISEATRPSDTVARLGGDEFAVLLESVRGLDDALTAAERIRVLFAAPFDLNGAEVVVSPSIGIAMAQDSIDAEELLRRADLAMYRVKARGKDGSAFFDPAMEDRAVDRLEVLNGLRKAVERNELVVHYQPIVDLESGTVVAAESLMRWDRPGHGLVPPLDFIPFAEETGLILPMGAWILKEACTQAREWQEPGAAPVMVGVNVSARQLMDPDFEHIVSRTLAETGLEPGTLVLEVTESSVMQNPELTIPKLDRIVQSGVLLTLDDFGEGHSSLSHLQRLPVQGLKVARPFVKGLADPHGDSRLVRGIIELAHSLELNLVAEGIELTEQRDALDALGCRLGQGFLFARPLELPAFRALLREQRRSAAAGAAELTSP